MPISRIVFALNDFITELGRISPRHDDDGEPLPEIAVELDADTYTALSKELSNHFGQAMPQVEGYSRSAMRFNGMTIICGVSKEG